MDVKIDTRLIRSEREKRAWTQAHLARVSGLGLRTVQRIERTGRASFDSVQALAAVLSLSAAELRVSGAALRRDAAPRTASWIRILLAAVSGAAAAAVFAGRFELEFDWAAFTMPGMLFAAGVLWPHLRVGRGLVRRALGLAAAGAASFTCAAVIALEGVPWLGIEVRFMPTTASLLAASIAGAGIVLAAARLLVPLRTTSAYWLLGALAAVVGGIGASLGLVGPLGGGTLATLACFCAWHVLMSLAIGHGRASSRAGRSVAAALRRLGDASRVGRYWFARVDGHGSARVCTRQAC